MFDRAVCDSCRTPSAGKVSILGHDMSLESERAKAFEVLGVCPQVDPVWEAWLNHRYMMKMTHSFKGS